MQSIQNLPVLIQADTIAPDPLHVFAVDSIAVDPHNPKDQQNSKKRRSKQPEVVETPEADLDVDLDHHHDHEYDVALYTNKGSIENYKV